MGVASDISQKIDPIEKQDVHVPKVVACIPAYQDEARLAQVVVVVRKLVDQVFVCDDASEDMTFDIAESLGVVAIRHDSTLGYNASLMTLYKNAQKADADFILTIDTEKQYTSSEISLLKERMLKGDVDVVIGSKYLDEIERDDRKAVQLSVRGVNLTDPNSRVIMFTRKVLDKINFSEDILGGSKFLTWALSSDFKVVEVPVHGVSEEETEDLDSKKPGASIFKSFVLRHPTLTLSGPGFLAILLAAVIGGIVLLSFLRGEFVSTNLIILGVGGALIGVVLVVAAIIIEAINSKESDP